MILILFVNVTGDLSSAYKQLKVLVAGYLGVNDVNQDGTGRASSAFSQHSSSSSTSMSQSQTESSCKSHVLLCCSIRAQVRGRPSRLLPLCPLNSRCCCNQTPSTLDKIRIIFTCTSFKICFQKSCHAIIE